MSAPTARVEPAPDPDLSDGDRDLPAPSSTAAISLVLDAPTSHWLVGTTLSPDVSDERVLAGVSVFTDRTAIATDPPPNLNCDPEEDPPSENSSFFPCHRSEELRYG